MQKSQLFFSVQNQIKGREKAGKEIGTKAVYQLDQQEQKQEKKGDLGYAIGEAGGGGGLEGSEILQGEFKFDFRQTFVGIRLKFGE